MLLKQLAFFQPQPRDLAFSTVIYDLHASLRGWKLLIKCEFISQAGEDKLDIIPARNNKRRPPLIIKKQIFPASALRASLSLHVGIALL